MAGREWQDPQDRLRNLEQRGASFYFGAVLADSQVVGGYMVSVPSRLPKALAGSLVRVGTAPAAPAVLSVQVNGVEKGTISIAVNKTVALAAAAAVALAVGDVVTLVGPAGHDANLADVAVLIHLEAGQ